MTSARLQLCLTKQLRVSSYLIEQVKTRLTRIVTFALYKDMDPGATILTEGFSLQDAMSVLEVGGLLKWV